MTDPPTPHRRAEGAGEVGEALTLGGCRKHTAIFMSLSGGAVKGTLEKSPL